jgi:hypothetical protein
MPTHIPSTDPLADAAVVREALDQIPKPDRSGYTALDFQGWREASALVLTPKFQRRGVWTTPARSYLIDTLIRRLPVPPLYLRVRQSDDHRRIIREVIDGQQRISAVLDFMDGKYALTRSLPAPYGGKTFRALAPEYQDAIRQYSFICEVLQAVSDEQVLEMFTRLNTYSVSLNNQELRNGRYFGFFKQTCYGLAHAHLEFWRRHHIFSDRGIARMLEVEFTSELAIAAMAGLQDKKASVSKFYAEYDDDFPEQQAVEAQFRANIDTIEDAVGSAIEDSAFRRVPLFYSLFCAVHHRQFGLPGVVIETPRKALTHSERQQLRETVTLLSSALELEEEKEPVPSRYQQFVVACLRQTDNVQPRRVRLETLYRLAF